MGNDVLQIVVLLGWLILAAGAFASFRLDWRSGLRLALVWAAIFTGLAIVISMIV
ncbi:hypothetical protein MKP08_10880 [Erythrobacter sp. LQ02-29]|uniref:hypothetical protein n=1 Tax=Erythrobacter sp. LQ02-29 TaxID=2920384 RepID=UPI001F4E96C4|nr:hypothetical protein [Erythrobacter sp. LQ02-29]MCP9223254.1 hypothetical protein [Erythrobacter sp. LQ02-29]